MFSIILTQSFKRFLYIDTSFPYARNGILFIVQLIECINIKVY